MLFLNASSGSVSSLLDANLTAGDTRPRRACLHSLALGDGELLGVVDGGQPEGELVGEEVAAASGSITLNMFSYNALTLNTIHKHITRPSNSTSMNGVVRKSSRHEPGELNHICVRVTTTWIHCYFRNQPQSLSSTFCSGTCVHGE